MESDQKDLYISELKAENFELRHRQGHFYDLRDRIAATEHEIALVNDDKRRILDEMRVRKAEDDDVIRCIQNDNDALRGTISARDAEIDDLKAQIAATKRDLDNVSADIRGVTDHNGNLRNDINNLENQLADERNLGRNLRADLDRARNTLKIKEDENAGALHAIRALEDDLNRNRLNEDDLSRVLADKNAELNDKTARLNALVDEINRLKATIDGQDKEAHDLGHRYGVQLDLTNKEKNELDRQAARNADLEATVRRLEDELAHLDADTAALRADVDRLRRVFADADVANKGLEDELNALNRHAQLLEGQNVDLAKELDAIVVADERIRADLDRKHRIAHLQHRNDDEIRDSINRLRYARTSPVRSPVRSPTRYMY